MRVRVPVCSKCGLGYFGQWADVFEGFDGCGCESPEFRGKWQTVSIEEPCYERFQKWDDA